MDSDQKGHVLELPSIISPDLFGQIHTLERKVNELSLSDGDSLSTFSRNDIVLRRDSHGTLHRRSQTQRLLDHLIKKGRITSR